VAEGEGSEVKAEGGDEGAPASDDANSSPSALAAGATVQLACPDNLLTELAASYLPAGTGLFPIPDYADGHDPAVLRAVVQNVRLDLEKDSLFGQLRTLAELLPDTAFLGDAQRIDADGVYGWMVGCWPPLGAAPGAINRYQLHKHTRSQELCGTLVCWQDKIINAANPRAWYDGSVFSDESRGESLFEALLTAITSKGDGTNFVSYLALVRYLGREDEEAMVAHGLPPFTEYQTWRPKKVRPRTPAALVRASPSR
jgi:hypothetical protein